MKKVMKMALDIFFSQIYLPYCKLVKRSWQVDERIHRNYISPFFGAMNLCEIPPQQVAQWFFSLSHKGLAPVTCNRILMAFRALCEHAHKLGFLDDKEALFINVKAHKVALQKQRVLSVEEAKNLIMTLQKEKSLAAYALRLLLLTGARKSEILKARWENIDQEKQILTVPVSKSGKPREIILSSQALEIIRELQKSSSSPWLFPGRGEGCLSDIYVFWNRIRNRLGLTGMRIHDLRHSFASLLVNAGHSLFEIQTLLGHANPRTTMRYASLSTETLINAVNSFGLLSQPCAAKSIVKMILKKSRDFIARGFKRKIQELE